MRKHGPEKFYIPKAKYIITVMIFSLIWGRNTT